MNRATVISYIIFGISLSSCGVPQSQYDELKAENERLSDEIIQCMDKKSLVSLHTESEALKHLKDYYEFYNANYAYRRPKIRRINDNTFEISLQTCINKQPFLSEDFHWQIYFVF